jgi:hypothetical protein
MKTYQDNMPVFYKLILVISLVCVAVITHNPAFGASQNSPAQTIDAGYSVLKLFLEDEQHLTAIRRVKKVITFKGISNNSTALIDEIADSSELALEQLEKLAAAKPAIILKDFSDDSIGKATLDSLRLATAKEFLFETHDFEKNLLLSQSQILRVISHLAKQLEEKETNIKRKDWLNKLAGRYENYYQQVYVLITISTKDSA